jgi:alpha-beta hydrolase superfamily lysophospholipase
MSAYKFSPDSCNSSFQTCQIQLKNDWQGEVLAHLIFKAHKQERSFKGAVLYIHGFIDYFFQWEMAQFYNDLGYDFYAIDLRKYGRSLLPHQKPNIIPKMEDYYEELDIAINIIREKSKPESIILNGHSTGGLLASLYAHDRPGVFSALILNSPFFQFNVPAWKRWLMLPLISLLQPILPELGMDSLTEVYPKSLHKNHYGEWDFNLKWKPIENFPAYVMWLKAIRGGQKRVHRGLNINVPVLLMHSDKSFKKRKYAQEALVMDAVLDVSHINKYGQRVGNQVSTFVVERGMHDLILSRTEVREQVYSHIKTWLSIVLK